MGSDLSTREGPRSAVLTRQPAHVQPPRSRQSQPRTAQLPARSLAPRTRPAQSLPARAKPKQPLPAQSLLPRAKPARAQPARARPEATVDRSSLAAQWSRSSGMPRTPFVLVVLALLGCGLVCLLVIYTTLAKASYQINGLQQQNAKLAQRAQSLQQQVSAAEAPAAIATRAYQLGMREQQVLRFVDLRTGKTFTQPAGGPTAAQLLAGNRPAGHPRAHRAHRGHRAHRIRRGSR